MLCLAAAACGPQSSGQVGEERTAGVPEMPPGQFEDAALPPLPSGAGLSLLQAQVALDRAGFSPGVIEGKATPAFQAALRAFQQAKGLLQTGELDAATRTALPDGRAIPPLRSIKLPANFLMGPYTPDIPRDLSAQAGLPVLGYRNALEKLAERFHTTTAYLLELNNPATLMRAGSVIRVPNIPDRPLASVPGADAQWNNTLAMLGISSKQPRAALVEVDRSEGVLKAFDGAGKLIAQFPATMGSRQDPLPLGDWTIEGVSRNPPFHYNPKLFWDAASTDRKSVLGPGPNGPVGVVWIELSKPHYGIHGTPEPALIGQSESHGCIRLSNWDAARLAQMLRPGVRATFKA